MQLSNELREIVGEEALSLNEPMSAHTTFRIGGPAEYFVNPSSIDQIKSIVELCADSHTPLWVLGCGSNILVADEGLSGVVMRLGPRFSKIELADDGIITAQAGARNSAIARAALDAGFGGFEFAAGIPGTIGGAAIMNAGAYGGELKDVALGVTCLTSQGQIAQVDADQAGWVYRGSSMANDGSIVLEVRLKLEPADPVAIKARMDDLAQQRQSKQPLDKASAGSTFKRPEGYYSGKLIQDSSLQGHSVGDAQVSPKHAGFIVNNGTARACDVRQLIDEVIEGVSQQFSVNLEPEVRFWGF